MSHQNWKHTLSLKPIANVLGLLGIRTYHRQCHHFEVGEAFNIVKVYSKCISVAIPSSIQPGEEKVLTYVLYIYFASIATIGSMWSAITTAGSFVLFCPMWQFRLNDSHLHPEPLVHWD